MVRHVVRLCQFSPCFLLQPTADHPRCLSPPNLQAKGLKSLHAKGLVHLDVHPGNVFMKSILEDNDGSPNDSSFRATVSCGR